MPAIPVTRLLLLALLAATPAASATASSTGMTAITGVRVFDGERLLPAPVTVLFGAPEGAAPGTIVAIGEQVPIPSGAAVVDGAGQTLLPGLIDAHTHAFGDALERALVFGVTTELDMFSMPLLTAKLRGEQAAGGAAGRADLFSAGTLVTAPGGHGTEYGFEIPTLDKAAEAAAFVDARIAEGSDWIKIVYDDGRAFGISFPTLDRETLAAAIAAAHARGKLAVVHVTTVEAARHAIAAGADGLAHAWADRADPELVKLVAERGTFVIPTLTVIESTTGAPSGASLITDPALAPYLNAAEKEGLAKAFPRREGSSRNLAIAQSSVGELGRSGVTLLAGSDAPNPGTAHGASIHRELELLVGAGLSPAQALTAATATPARVFRLADRGRIEPGRRADLLLVAGDPTTDITATRRIRGVWKAGLAASRPLAAAPPAPAAPAPTAAGASGLVSDFEEAGAAPQARFGAGWQVSTDGLMGGQSTATMEVVDGGAAGTARALRVDGAIAPGSPFPWAGAMFFPAATPMAPADLSRFKEIVFWAKGDGGTYRVMLFATRLGRAPAEQRFVAGPEWREVVLPLASFAELDGSDLRGVLFSAGVQQTQFAFRIDQVSFR